MQRPVVNTEAGSNPGAPLAWGSPENPDDAVAGYGYVPCDTSEVEETFYYHSDHLGSTSYITDQQANVTQYDAYLPYGELLVDEHSSSADLPYKFNGKELDEETGLYYYGARYMNPLTSMWYGVDPLTEKYPNVSAFVYCHDNPVVRVDPDGQDDYKMDREGYLQLWRRSNAKYTDRIYASNGKQNITISKKTMRQFMKTRSDYRGHYAIGGKEMKDVFNFVVNNSDVEWFLVGYKKGDSEKMALMTGHSWSDVRVKTNFADLKEKDMIFTVHNHPQMKYPNPSGWAEGDIVKYKNGDIEMAVGDRSTAMNISLRFQKDYRGKKTPLFYMYHTPTQTLVRYDQNKIRNRKKIKDGKFPF